MSVHQVEEYYIAFDYDGDSSDIRAAIYDAEIFADVVDIGGNGYVIESFESERDAEIAWEEIRVKLGL